MSDKITIEISREAADWFIDWGEDSEGTPSMNEISAACCKALDANKRYLVSIHENWGSGKRVASYDLTREQVEMLGQNAMKPGNFPGDNAYRVYATACREVLENE